MNETIPVAPATERARRPNFGLSGKLLVLTLLFVMLAEVLIYVPSVANFRLNWLKDRLAAAHVAAMVLKAAPRDMVPQDLKREILSEIGAKAVALKMDNTRHLLAIGTPRPDADPAKGAAPGTGGTARADQGTAAAGLATADLAWGLVAGCRAAQVLSVS